MAQTTLFPKKYNLHDFKDDDEEEQQDRCGICGKPLVRNRIESDKRSIKGKLRCFDHIGVE